MNVNTLRQAEAQFGNGLPGEEGETAGQLGGGEDDQWRDEWQQEIYHQVRTFSLIIRILRVDADQDSIFDY